MRCNTLFFPSLCHFLVDTAEENAAFISSRDLSRRCCSLCLGSMIWRARSFFPSRCLLAVATGNNDSRHTHSYPTHRRRFHQYVALCSRWVHSWRGNNKRGTSGRGGGQAWLNVHPCSCIIKDPLLLLAFSHMTTLPLTTQPHAHRNEAEQEENERRRLFVFVPSPLLSSLPLTWCASLASSSVSKWA